MAYTLSYSGGTITVADGTVNTDTSLQLPGRNFSGYGTFQNQNFVNLMQNFASSSSPTNAIRGQLWFDTTTNRLKYNTSPTKGIPTWVEIAGSGSSTNVVFGDITADSIITDTITSGSISTPGTITGQWSLTSGSTLQIQKASTSVLGTVMVDGTTITIASNGMISAVTGGGGGGTVTSVGLTVPAGLSVTGSPVTSSGTLGITTALNGIVAGTGSGFTTVTVGSGLSYSGGTLSATGYTLPTSSPTVLGGVKVDGSSITIDGNGIIRAEHLGDPTNSGTAVVPNNGLSDPVTHNLGRIPVILLWVAEGAFPGVNSPGAVEVTVNSFKVSAGGGGGTVYWAYW